MTQEQKDNFSQLLPALERLHGNLDVHGSAAFVELAYFWTGKGVQGTVEEAQKSLEFLAQQAEEAAQQSSQSGVVAGLLELRKPWRTAGDRSLSPHGVGEDFPSYGEFMLAAVGNLHALVPEQRTRYLGLVKFAVETELGTGSKFTEGSLKALPAYGLDAVERYARAGFEWLGMWRSSQKDTHHKSWVGTEVLQSLWYFMMEHKGSEEGAQRLREYLVQFGEVADYMEHNMFFSIAQGKLMEGVFVPANKMAIWQVFREISELANRGERIGYRLWEVVNSATDLAKVEKEEDAVRFAQALKGNYVATLAKALERSNGKAEGLAGDLLDRRNAGTIAERINDDAFWQSLSGVVSEVPLSSPGAWVPETSEGAASLLDAVKGPNFVAERGLLVASIDDIAERTGYGPVLNVLDLGVGNGEKLSAMLKAWGPKLEQVNACLVDKNFFIAFAGAEELIRSLRFADGELFFDSRSISLHGKMWTQDTGTPVTITAIVEYFERLKQHPAYQEFTRNHQDYLTTMLGTTLCNFEPEAAMTLLDSLAKKRALVGLYLYEGDDAKLIQDYDTPENLRMGQHHLLRQGVREEDFGKLEHIVEVRKRHEVIGQSGMGIVARLLTYFRVRSGQKVQGTLREFSAGDVINVGLSLKYTDEQARKLFESSGLGLVKSYYEGSVGLYLLERLPVPQKAHSPGR